MELLIAIGLLILGFTILIIGGEGLIRSSVSMAAKLKISPAVIGLTIVAAGTSAPEVATSFMASLKGSHDIAIGNIIGSNIFNILAILGLTSLIKVNSVDKNFLTFDLPALVVFTLVFAGVIYNQNISPIEGGFFFFLLTLFFILTVRRSRKSFNNNEDESLERLKNPVYDVFYLLFGLGALVGGAQMALKGGVQLGQIIGLSERVIGLTIISVGTGLPELATSIIATVRGRSDLAIANVIGSNIINTLGVPAVAIIPGIIPVAEHMANRDSYILLGVTLLFFAILQFNKGFLGHKSGALLLVGYMGYVYYLI